MSDIFDFLMCTVVVYIFCPVAGGWMRKFLTAFLPDPVRCAHRVRRLFQRR